LALLELKNLDALAPLEPKQSQAWRQLDVAILQRAVDHRSFGSQQVNDNAWVSPGYPIGHRGDETGHAKQYQPSNI